MITKRERLEAMAREWRQYADSHSGERAQTFAHCSRVLLEALRGEPVPQTTLMADRPEQAPLEHPKYVFKPSVVERACGRYTEPEPEQAPQGAPPHSYAIGAGGGDDGCSACGAGARDTCRPGCPADTTKPEEPR